MTQEQEESWLFRARQRMMADQHARVDAHWKAVDALREFEKCHYALASEYGVGHGTPSIPGLPASLTGISSESLRMTYLISGLTQVIEVAILPVHWSSSGTSTELSWTRGEVEIAVRGRRDVDDGSWPLLHKITYRSVKEALPIFAAFLREQLALERAR